jgi:uncharacterized protein (TIGR02996 family)
MSEEAAFIAAILTSPADDMNRLVYADWLDDRADPRGAYLRAEVKWAGSRNAKDQAGAGTRARPLDPVWCARVSRPPIGVCCDHVHIDRDDDETKAVTSNELDRLEKRFGLTLPPDYRAFLLNYNGGRPTPTRLGWPRGSAYNAVAQLHGVYADVEPSQPKRSPGLDWEPNLVHCLLFLEWARAPKRRRDWERRLAEYWQGEPQRDLIFVGYSPPTGYQEVYCLGVRGEQFGKVSFVAASPFHDCGERSCVPVADSFAAFLALLTGRRKRKTAQKRKPKKS